MTSQQANKTNICPPEVYLVAYRTQPHISIVIIIVIEGGSLSLRRLFTSTL
jgi:hypothetical protein